MGLSRLADFIRNNIEPILAEWESFARTIEPPALTMDDDELRDHAHQMLMVIANDLDTSQTDTERVNKSRGNGPCHPAHTAAHLHAEVRLRSGYTIVQLVSEYRALRASVLALWAARFNAPQAGDIVEITRFNEAVDQALAESVERYQDLVKQSQNMFLAILGHDLRNPLGTVAGGSSFMMQAADIPARYVLMATRMFTSAKRMSTLINDLIDFTRTHLGPGIPLRVRKSDLVCVCQQVVDEQRICHPERCIELHAPPVLDAIFDDSRIAQMLSNFVGNAVQYGAAEAPITIKVDTGDEHIVFAINNKGPTIPGDKIASIFDPMARIAAGASNDDNERTSLGIGLYIAREIVHAHGGHVDVDSNETEGTTFTVTIPLRQTGLRASDVPAGAPGQPQR